MAFKYKFPNYYPTSEEKKKIIIVFDITTNVITTNKHSQFGSAEGAESEVSLHLALAETAAQGFGHRRRRFGGGGQRVIVGEEVLTRGAMEERILGRPPPHGNEEELENLVGVHEINAVAAVHALAYTGFQNLLHLLL